MKMGSMRVVCQVLLALVMARQVRTDCEICQKTETEGTVTTAGFEYDLADFSLDDGELFGFVRMKIEGEKLKKKHTGLMNLTINGRTQANLQGCFAKEIDKFEEHLGMLDVTWMSRAMNLSESDRCTGKDQTSVRIAQLAEGMEVFATRNESMSVEISVDGPSSVSEVCVGYEGGSCNMTGQGHSYRRCFANPSMSDGCQLTITDEGSTVLLTSQPPSNDSSSSFSINRTDESHLSVNFSGFDSVYLGSTASDIIVTASDIEEEAIIEVVSNEQESDKTVMLSDSGNTTVFLSGRGYQTATVSAVGETFLTALISNNLKRNRINVNGRCSQSVRVESAIKGDRGEWNFYDRWIMRVGCPRDPFKPCSVEDRSKSRAKHVIVGAKQAWKEGWIQVSGHSRSFPNAYAAFYEDSELDDFEDCCWTELCDFTKHCKLKSDGDGTFTLDDLCGGFVLSFYVPFAHLLVAVSYLITVASMFVMAVSKEAILRSKHIKLIFITLCECFLFGAYWAFGTLYYGIQRNDLFENVNSSRYSKRSLYHLFILRWLHYPIAADMRSLQFALFDESYQRVLREKEEKTMLFVRPQWERFCYVNGVKPLGISQVIIVSMVGIYGGVNEVPWTAVVVPVAIFYVAIPLSITGVIGSFLTGFPELGAVIAFIWIVNSILQGFSGVTIATVLGLVLWHLYNFFLVWGLIFHCTDEKIKLTMYSWKNVIKTCYVRMIESFKVFAKIFDLLTDQTVVVFFLVNGQVLFGLIQLFFVASAVAVSVYFEWRYLHSWTAKMALLCGFNLVVQVLDPALPKETKGFLKEAELHLESLPSLLFGLFVLSTSPRKDTGPILFSLGVTWLTLSLKAYGTIDKLKGGYLKKGLVFVILVGDFFVRCVSLTLLLALIQGQQGSYPRWPSICAFCGIQLAELAGYMAFYRRRYPLGSGRTPFYLRALFSLLSCRSALFAYLRMDHYSADSIITGPSDLVLLTLPHCLVSAAFSTIALFFVFQSFPGLIVVTLLFSVLQPLAVVALVLLFPPKLDSAEITKEAKQSDAIPEHVVIDD